MRNAPNCYKFHQHSAYFLLIDCTWLTITPDDCASYGNSVFEAISMRKLQQYIPKSRYWCNYGNNGIANTRIYARIDVIRSGSCPNTQPSRVWAGAYSAGGV